MLSLILLIIAIAFFINTGIGFVILNFLAIGLIEVFALLFTSIIGFVILGLIISVIWPKD